MKNNLKLLGRVFLLIFSVSTPLTTSASVNPMGVSVSKHLMDLKNAEKQITVFRMEVRKKQRLLERNIISMRERASLRDRIGEVQGIISVYQAEGLLDVGYLRGHWNALTPWNREQVDQAKVDLED